MAELPSVAFRFTEEELVVLFEESVGSPDDLPYAELLPEYDERQRGLALDVARRSLLARGTLQVAGDEGIKLNDLGYAAAAAGLILDARLTFARRSSEGTYQVVELYDLDETTRLMHTTVGDKLHEYVVLHDDDLLASALRFGVGLADEELASTENAVSFQPMSLPVEVWTGALAEASSGDAAAVEAVLAIGSANEAISSLAVALTTSSELTTLVHRTESGEDGVAEPALLFLHGNGLWWQVDKPDEDGPVILRNISALDVDHAVRDFARL